MYSVKRGLWELQQREQEKWLDALGEVGEALREWRAAIVTDLGGEESLSAMELAIVDTIVRSHLILCSVDRYLLSIPSVVNRQKHELFAVVLQRDTLANSIARNLERLGLERRAKALPSIQEYMAGKDAEKVTAAKPPAPHAEP